MNTTNKTAVEEIKDPWDTFIKELEPFDISPSVMNTLCTLFREEKDQAQAQAKQEGAREERARCVKALEDDLDILSDCTDKSYNRHVEYKEDENGFYSGEKNGYIGAYAVINHTRKALQLPDKE